MHRTSWALRKARDAMARRELALWIRLERSRYADVKFEDDTAGRENLFRATKEEGYGDTWNDFVQNYLTRAKEWGIDTPKGRQALGKAIVTLMHCLETGIQVYGDMPEPGHTTGEVREWTDER